MPTPTRGPRLGGSPAHERLLLSNLATALFEHGRITTTVAKAKRLRPVAERLVTFAKRGDLHARRQVLTVVRDKKVVHHLFAEIGPRYATRPGGYLRITRVGNRKGDNAPMAAVELVEGLTVGQQAVGEAERARGTRFARGRGGAAAATAIPAAGGPAADASGAGEAPANEPAADEPAADEPAADEPAVSEEDLPDENAMDPAAEPGVESGTAGESVVPEAVGEPTDEDSTAEGVAAEAAEPAEATGEATPGPAGTADDDDTEVTPPAGSAEESGG